MELQALLVLCGIGLVGAAVLLLMGLFSSSGTSYEEAIAQQRRATSELLALADNKNKSKKTSKKANKKLAKKEKKENVIATTGSEPESEAPGENGVDNDAVPSKPHVEFNPAVVVEHPTDNPPNITKIRKRGKDPKIKPILINKEDPSCVSDPSTAATPIEEVSNHFEEMHPKDEVELLQSALEKAAEKKEEKKEEIIEKRESKAPKPSKGAKATPKQSPPEPAKEEPASEKQNINEAPLEQRKGKKGEKKIVAETLDVAEEVVPPLNVPQPTELTTDKLLRQALPPTSAPAPSPPAKSKKKKTDQDMLSLMASEGSGVAFKELIRVVRQATLSDDEIQILTDALFNHEPQPAHSEWTEGPNDPMQKLKKQLADKEKALADELEASKALKAKVQELRANLNAERAALGTARAEQHTQQTRLQRLLEEHHTIMQEKNTLLAQLGENETQISRMDSIIQRLSETEGGLRAEAAGYILEAGQARDDAVLAHQHNAELTQQLQDINLALADLEQQRQFAVHAEQLAQQELRQAQARLAGLNELQKDLQHWTAKAQAAESNAEALASNMEKQKEEFTKEIATLQEQLAAKEEELAELKQLKAVPAQNGLPPNRVNDEQKAAELAMVESTVESLRNELISAQESISEQKKQVASLQEQIAQYRDKNNEAAVKAQEQHFAEVANVLRAVCPTAAPNSSTGQEWLQAFAENLKKELLRKETEKQQIENDLAAKLLEKDNVRKQMEVELQKKLQEKEVTVKEIESKMQQQIQDKEFEFKTIINELQKKLEDELNAKEQSERELQKKLQEELSLKEKLESELQKKEVKEIHIQQPIVDDSRVKDLESQNVYLQEQVKKYKSVIDDTEIVLSRLQQKVSREEARWQTELENRQSDLESLRQRAVQQMQSKIDSLQAELQRLQTKNHSHSFADAERIVEEKLMAGCASHHETEVHNGPLQ